METRQSKRKLTEDNNMSEGEPAQKVSKPSESKAKKTSTQKSAKPTNSGVKKTSTEKSAKPAESGAKKTSTQKSVKPTDSGAKKTSTKKSAKPAESEAKKTSTQKSSPSAAEQKKGGTKSSDGSEESEDDFDDYYQDEDVDAREELQAINETRDKTEVEMAATSQFQTGANAGAVKRLIKDMQMISSSRQFGFEAGPRGSNLFLWDVKLLDFDTETTLGKDLEKYAKKFKEEPVIHLTMEFPQTYPFSPPFVRVLKPRFKYMTGHVTLGGNVCTQMLTMSGWQPTNNIESTLVQVRAVILSDPNAALDPHRPNLEYTEAEAKFSFKHMLQTHKW